MNFVNMHELCRDTALWERDLPQVDAFVGVPRSGLIPATILSLRRNVRLVPLRLLFLDPENCIERSPLRDNNPAVSKRPKPQTNAIMIVDDCTGEEAHTMKALHQQFEVIKPVKDFKLYYGAVYTASKNTPEVDYSYRHLAKPRLFEWNFFRHYSMHDAMWDMDGVICEDWTGKEAREPEKYAEHLASVRPLYLPEHPVRTICTNRLERCRPQTEEWLERYNVPYNELKMYPGSIEQRAKDRSSGYKAEIYKNSDCKLFVESDPMQAREIHLISKKPVLSIQEMRIFNL